MQQNCIRLVKSRVLAVCWFRLLGRHPTRQTESFPENTQPNRFIHRREITRLNNWPDNPGITGHITPESWSLAGVIFPLSPELRFQSHRPKLYRYQVKLILVRESFPEQKVPSWRGQLWRRRKTGNILCPRSGNQYKKNLLSVNSAGDKQILRHYNSCEDYRCRRSQPDNPDNSVRQSSSRVLCIEVRLIIVYPIGSGNHESNFFLTTECSRTASG